jgi:hypothetical protein
MSSSLNGIFGAVKALIPGVYIFVAKASYIFGNVSPGIIAAQNAQIDNNNRIYDFGDYDGIVSGHRLSNVDYAIAGMADATLIGYPKIAAFLDAH